jgi:hypothetical protein
MFFLPVCLVCRFGGSVFFFCAASMANQGVETAADAGFGVRALRRAAAFPAASVSYAANDIMRDPNI